VTRLAGGAANRSFRLQDGPRDYVLRLSGDAAARLGANARSEVAMQSLAAGEGLAPRIVLAEPSGGYVVSEFVGGCAPLEHEMQEPGLLARVGAWCARLHALDVPAGIDPVDFGARAAGCLARLPDEGDGGVVAHLRRELAQRRAALPEAGRLVPCHHDLHRRNLLDDGARLVAVDWEYAGPGDAAADLAACAGYHALDAAGIDALVAGYGAADTDLRARIAAVAWIFDCLWYGWNAVAAQEGLKVSGEEQSRLAARLLG
jgi:aminoglycoside phosphotransferase (APT) family kinase protein